MGITYPIGHVVVAVFVELDRPEWNILWVYTSITTIDEKLPYLHSLAPIH